MQTAAPYISSDDLIEVHNLIDVERPDSRIEAANMALDRWMPNEKVHNVNVAIIALTGLFRALLEAERYGAAAFLCWGDISFNPRPRCVRLIWSCLRKYVKLLIMGASALGKCLGKGTGVLMFDGSIKKVEDIQVGDQLMGDDSTPRTVLSLSRGRSNMLKISPSHGQPWVCNEDHVLTLRCSCNKPNGDRKTISSTYTKGRTLDIPAKEYINSSPTFRHHYRQFSVGVKFLHQSIPFDPYIYGLWIGDGGVNNAVLHNADPAIIKTWCDYFKSIGYYIGVNRKGGTECHGYFARYFPLYQHGNSCAQNPFRRFVKTSFIGDQKRILPSYLVNDSSVRLKLLAGIIDTDGSAQSSGFTVTTKYPGLADDLCYLARSLGFVAYKSQTIKRIKSLNFSGVYFCVWINGRSELVDSIPTILKKRKEPGNGNDPTNVGIQIDALPVDDYFGFTTDGNHRFLLADFTVTHNSYNVYVFDLLDFARDPIDTTIKIISTTAGHAKAQAMSTLVRLHRESVIPLPGYIRQGYIGMDKDNLRSSISELAIDKGSELQGSSGKLQGFHPYPRRKAHPVFGIMSRVRARLEECEDIPAPVWPGVTNMMATAGAGTVSVAGLFNPRRRDSATAQRAEPLNGWNSFNINKSEEWESKYGFHVLRLDGAKCENVMEHRIVYPGLLDYEGYHQHSPDSADHATFSRGAYPTQTISFAIISPLSLDQSRGHFIWQKIPTDVGALDMAEEGRDKAIFTAAKYGLAIGFEPEGKQKIMFSTPRWCAQIDQQFALEKQNTIRMGAEAIKLCRMLNIRPEWFALDCTNSVNLRDWMRLSWGDILGIKWGEAATDLPILAEGQEKASDLFDNVKTEMFFACGEWAEFGYLAFAPHMDTSRLFAQLSGMRYKPTGKTSKRCEETKEFKKRYGGDSPDEAASCVMIVHAIRMHSEQAERPAMEPGMRTPLDQDVLHEPQGEFDSEEEAIDSIEYVY